MSLRQAVNLKCRDCIYDPCEKGRWKEQIERCDCLDCPLYAVRPKPRNKSSKTLSFRAIKRTTYIKPLGKVAVYWKNTKTVSYLSKATAFHYGESYGA